MRKSLLSLLLLTRLVWGDPLQDEMTNLANLIFSGNGTVDLIEWEDFSFQLTPEMDPVDLTKVPPDQRENAKFLFMKSQGIATLERNGKTMTGFLESRGFTVAIRDHYYNPVLYYAKEGEPSRRFDFVRKDGKLKLCRVSLQPPGSGP